MKILYWTGWALSRAFMKVPLRARFYGRENVPAEGGFIFASNHRSYFDPPLVGSAIGRELFFFAKRELFDTPVLGWVIHRTNARPVKRGTIDREALKTSVDIIRRGYGLTIFPEGTRSKTDEFLSPKAGLGLIAAMAECPVVPAYIHGSNRLKDCLLGRDRFFVAIGEPLSSEWVKSFERSKEGYLAMSRAVMDRIKSLRESHRA